MPLPISFSGFKGFGGSFFGGFDLSSIPDLIATPKKKVEAVPPVAPTVGASQALPTAPVVTTPEPSPFFFEMGEVKTPALDTTALTEFLGGDFAAGVIGGKGRVDDRDKVFVEPTPQIPDNLLTLSQAKALDKGLDLDLPGEAPKVTPTDKLLTLEQAQAFDVDMPSDLFGAPADTGGLAPGQKTFEEGGTLTLEQAQAFEALPLQTALEMFTGKVPPAQPQPLEEPETIADEFEALTKATQPGENIPGVPPGVEDFTDLVDPEAPASTQAVLSSEILSGDEAIVTADPSDPGLQDTPNISFDEQGDELAAPNETEQGKVQREARNVQRRSIRSRRGRQSTLVTGPLGLVDPATISKPSLLGF